MPGTIATYPAGLFYEVAFHASPNQSSLPLWFTDLSARTKTSPQQVNRGRQYELDVNQAGVWRTVLENKDGALDPSNAASPFAPGVVPYRACRIRARAGVNALTGDQATAGDATGYGAGPVPAQFNINSGAGYAISTAAAADAYQGAHVYQVAVPNGATSPKDLLDLTQVPVIPGTAYAAQLQGRMLATAQNLNVHVSINWLDTSGNTISTTVGSNVTVTGGAATWLQIAAAGTAPAGAYSATIRAVLGTTTTATASFQADAVQWEQSATATGFQVPQTLPPNLLPRYVATGTAGVNTLTDAAGNYFASSAGSVAQATGLAAAPNGATTAVAWTTPAGTGSATPFYCGAVAALAPALDGPVADCVQVTAGVAYTASTYLMRASSADATVQVQVGIRWYDATGAVISASNGTATTVPVGSWARVSVANATAPAGAVWGRPRFFISSPASTTATNTIYSTGWQMEAATSASTWLDPGPTAYLYTGMVERWPQTWIMSGTYGTVQTVGVDALAALAQYTVTQPLLEEILTLGPNFVYALNDPSGATSCADVSGKRPAAPIENSPFGSGSLTLGSTVTAASAAGLMLGTAGPVATFNNPAPNPSPETFVSLHKATSRPGPPATGSWSRLIAFRCPTTPTAGNYATLWFGGAPAYSTDLSSFQLFITGGTGTLAFTENGASTFAGPSFTSASSVCDGNWHLAGFQFESSGGYFGIYLDGVRVYHDNNAGAGWVTVTSQVADVLGALAVPGGAITGYGLGFVGDLAVAAEIPAALTAAQHLDLYNSFRSASSGESSGARATRVLNWVGWPGPIAIDSGQTTSMGPATDLVGSTALDALNAVALAENGNFFVSNAGEPTFTSRTRRYGQLTPAVIFGENASLGEWPYQDLTADYDPRHLFNWVQVTQSSTGQVASAQDATSQASYFPHVLQRAINTGLFTEAQDAANYLLGQYKAARLRIANLTLNPSAIPGLFAVCLELEIGTRVRVMRRTASAPGIQFDGFIESVAWTIDPDSGQAIVQLQCSPADLASYWLLAALHTTLSAQAASGQAQATINALPDSAVNALASSLPAGYQLTFDPGTPIAETMTLAPGGIPNTTPGYTTATLTFTSNFTNTHAAGTVVCEPLPAGYTDPATWDAVSTLGAAYGTLAIGVAGASSFPMNTLGDAKTNALASDWAAGDVIWINPGGATWEGWNMLHPNVSTGGQGAIPLPAGSNGNAYGVGAFYGTPTVTASGTPFQGLTVWQAAVSGGATTGHTLINVAKVPVAPNLPFTWSIYVRSVTSSQNPQVHPNIQWLDAGGNSLGSATGGTVTLTGSPSASWTRLTVTGTAPSAAVWAAPSVFLDVAPASAWSFQADGLQLEQSSSASTYQTAPQIKSVAAAAAGYSSVLVTLAQPLAFSHAAGEYVCDPLPPGVTNPALAAGTSRLAY